MYKHDRVAKLLKQNSLSRRAKMKHVTSFVPSVGHHERVKQRDAMREWLIQNPNNFELSVTLNFNRDIGWDAARDKLKEWAQRVDYAYLGRAYHRASDHRLFFVAFLENANTNPHLHLLVVLPTVPWRRLMTPKFRNCRKLGWHRELLKDQWAKLVKSGSVDTEKIYDEQGIIIYDTKQLARKSSIEHFVISTEFHSAPGPAGAEILNAKQPL